MLDMEICYCNIFCYTKELHGLLIELFEISKILEIVFESEQKD